MLHPLHPVFATLIHIHPPQLSFFVTLTSHVLCAVCTQHECKYFVADLHRAGLWTQARQHPPGPTQLGYLTRNGDGGGATGEIGDEDEALLASLMPLDDWMGSAGDRSGGLPPRDELVPTGDWGRELSGDVNGVRGPKAAFSLLPTGDWGRELPGDVNGVRCPNATFSLLPTGESLTDVGGVSVPEPTVLLRLLPTDDWDRELLDLLTPTGG